MSVSEIKDSACICTERPENPTANEDRARENDGERSLVLDKILVALPTSRNGIKER